MKEIYDISLVLTPQTMTYPGNPEVTFQEKSGGSSTLTELTLGTHTGTHVDAPSHVFSDAQGMGCYDLENFIGECLVIDVTDAEGSVTPEDISDIDIVAGDRLLFKTKNSLQPYDEFREDFIFIHGDTAELLAEKQVCLVGIDYLSIKERGSDDNRPHTALLKNKIPILEGINLSEVSPGRYELLCLPLRLDDRDGAPARAVLRDL